MKVILTCLLNLLGEHSLDFSEKGFFLLVNVILSLIKIEAFFAATLFKVFEKLLQSHFLDKQRSRKLVEAVGRQTPCKPISKIFLLCCGQFHISKIGAEISNVYSCTLCKFTNNLRLNQDIEKISICNRRNVGKNW